MCQFFILSGGGAGIMSRTVPEAYNVIHVPVPVQYVGEEGVATPEDLAFKGVHEAYRR